MVRPEPRIEGSQLPIQHNSEEKERASIHDAQEEPHELRSHSGEEAEWVEERQVRKRKRVHYQVALQLRSFNQSDQREPQEAVHLPLLSVEKSEILKWVRVTNIMNIF